KTLPLSPKFASNTYSYTAKAETPMLSVEVSAVPNNPGATYSVNGETPASAGKAIVVDLPIGDTDIKVVVTASSGGGMRTYALTVTRPEGAAGAPQNVVLTPEAGRIALAWELPLYSGISDLVGCLWRIRWRVAADGGAENAWQDKNGAQENGYLVATPSARSYIIENLTAGVAYDVQIAGETDWGIGLWSDAQRAVVAAASLRGVTLTSGGQTLSLSPKFASNTYSYTAKAVTPMLSVEVSALPNPGAAYSVNGETPASADQPIAVKLPIGDTAIKVVAAAGGGMRTYALTVTRPEGAAGAPQNVVLTPEAGRIALAWELPLYSGVVDLFGCQWRIRWRMAADGGAENPWQGGEAGAQEDGQILLDVSARSYTIKGLAAGVEYDVQVAGATHWGIGIWSDAQRAAADSLLDVDGNDICDNKDGILISRYLLGLRGRALTAGVSDADASEIQSRIAVAAAGGGLDVDQNDQVNAADGIMILRYLLGVTDGRGLTDGQSNMAAPAVAKKIMGMMP
ncbi:MAG: cadherin-like beta sandwich domain-containing protein, partial [Gammaproteobacteria bacterium]